MVGCKGLHFSGGPYAQIGRTEGTGGNWIVGAHLTLFDSRPAPPAVPQVYHSETNFHSAPVIVNNGSASQSSADVVQSQSQSSVQENENTGGDFTPSGHVHHDDDGDDD